MLCLPPMIRITCRFGRNGGKLFNFWNGIRKSAGEEICLSMNWKVSCRCGESRNSLRRGNCFRGQLYLDVYEKDHVTPYIHILVCHTISLMKQLDIPLESLSQQGFEATHKWHKSIYFHSTSHDGCVGKKRFVTSSIKQILGNSYSMNELINSTVKIYRMHFIRAFKSPDKCKQTLRL